MATWQIRVLISDCRGLEQNEPQAMDFLLLNLVNWGPKVPMLRLVLRIKSGVCIQVMHRS